MPRVEYDPSVVVGLREHLTKQAHDLMMRLETADPGYGFGAEVARLRKRLDDLLDGADVLVYRHELGDFAPPRDGNHAFALRGNRLVEAEYERVVPAQRDG
jgi:hypothetical protein